MFTKSASLRVVEKLRVSYFMYYLTLLTRSLRQLHDIPGVSLRLCSVGLLQLGLIPGPRFEGTGLKPAYDGVAPCYSTLRDSKFSQPWPEPVGQGLSQCMRVI